jgi:hypothetical protein
LSGHPAGVRRCGLAGPPLKAGVTEKMESVIPTPRLGGGTVVPSLCFVVSVVVQKSCKPRSKIIGNGLIPHPFEYRKPLF